ncbi:glycosyltransferase [Myxococcota bacterium]|nr:glycosyltransferase [Myxococcota bacterium]
MRIVILGLSITSSWGNGHATTWRGLVRGLAARGHDVLFLERDAPWYARNRDLPKPPWGRTELYHGVSDLEARFGAAIAAADLAIVGSYVPDGVEVGRLVVATARGIAAFYDIDTPVTLASLARGDAEYLSHDLLPLYHLYLSFAGGPVLERLAALGARNPRALYCSVDPDLYHPEPATPRWDLGYMGTHCEDRMPVLERLLLDPARRHPAGRFVVAGPMYPEDPGWPANVERIVHVSPREHRAFYNRQRFTLNLTRADMARAGWSPSVRLFEAAACGTPIVSDAWPGLETLLEPGSEVLLAGTAEEALAYLLEVSEARRRAVGARARQRVLASHTCDHRAAELLAFVGEGRGRLAP